MMDTSFEDNINLINFFWWERSSIFNDSFSWANLPKSSKTVFPVIVSFADKTGKSFPSESTIASLSGITEKTVRQGVRKLEGYSGFSFYPRITSHGKISKMYVFKNKYLHKESNPSFPFYKSIISSYVWKLLSPNSKSLYPVMRCFGWFETNLFKKIDNTKFLRKRYYDFCDAEKEVLVKYSGIKSRNLNSTIKDLESHNLIKKIKTNIFNGFIVYFHPLDVYEPYLESY